MLTIGEQDVWQCPRCGRGSPDSRDEAAHLDAHRRLERDRTLVTWDLLVHRLTRPEPDSGDEDRRRAPMLLAVLATVLLGSLLLSVRSAEDVRGRGNAAPAPPPTSQSTAPVPSTTPARSVADETFAQPPPASTPPPEVDAGALPASPPPIAEPATAGPAPTTTIPVQPVDSPHIVRLCLPSLCLAI